VVHALKAEEGGVNEGTLLGNVFSIPFDRPYWLCCQFQQDHLKWHDRFPSQAFKVKLNWSKNVLEERDAPWQTVLGSIDSSFCVFLNLAILVWLEMSCRRISPYVFNFSEDIAVPSGVIKAKNRAMDVLRVVLRELELDLEEGEVGTHWIRKCASTHVRGNGVSKDDKDTRGRWKLQSVSLTYMTVSISPMLIQKWRLLYVLEAHIAIIWTRLSFFLNTCSSKSSFQRLRLC
jgi:hypothetical protein